MLIVALAVSTALVGLAGCSPSSDSPDAACPNDLPASCPTPPPSWSNDVAPLVDKYCLACHGDGGIAQPLFDFTTYQNVYANRMEITHQFYACLMPPSDASPLPPVPSTAEREMLLAWLKCGAPNN